MNPNRVFSFCCLVKDYTKLHEAAGAGDIKTVNSLLQRKVDVNAKTLRNETPLHYAAQRGHMQVVKALIANNANLEDTTDEYFTPLHLALQQSHFEVSDFLIKNGANVKACDNLNWTPLHNVCYNGFSLPIVQALIQKGADINARTSDGRSPLHLASEQNYTEILSYLIENGADVDAQDYRQWSPLHCAAYDGNLKVVKTLLKKVSNIDAKTEKSTTPLHFAVDHGYLEVTQVLLEKGANVNAQDHTNWSPLHFSTEKGNEKMSELLLKFGADVNAKDNQNGTPLHLAAQYKHPRVLNILLMHKPDVNAPIKGQEATPLHLAAQSGSFEMAEALLSKGAYFDARAKALGRHLVPLDFAKMSGNAKVIQLLERVEKLFDAVGRNDSCQLRVCIEAGAMVNAKNSSGRMPLHFAVSNSNIDAVNSLLANKADITQLTTKGNSTLHLAVSKDNNEITEALLQHGRKLSPIEKNCFINAKTSTDKTTALHIATKNRNLYIVKLLLENGAIFNAKNKEGKTPSELTADDKICNVFYAVEKLFEAVKSCDEGQAAELLCKEKCIVNARDDVGGGTPLYWSVLNGYEDMVQLLLNNGADAMLVTNKCNTPLHIASSKGYSKIVESLLQHVNSVDGKLNHFINIQTTTGGTGALHIASNVDIVKKLLQYGAVYNIKNKEGKKPLDLAQNDDIKALLNLTHKLFELAKKANAGIIGKMKDLKADELGAVTNARNKQDLTLLQVAITKGPKNIARKLAEVLQRLNVSEDTCLGEI
ncbi:unnamed protein product [Bemisia tabaci]|uniref:Uncharacterized protein n=1 Tax=Bemisia tabaci TaxID=7038 RepID=A0A9P0AH99_BEMTA|nr:unnamed protein product [Bemisia tabaci]